MKPQSFALDRRAALALLLLAGPALAQETSRPAKYPDRPVRLVVPFAAGGTSDIVARLIAEKASTSTGQPWIVDNKPGAGAAIGTTYVAKAAADGYTILLGAAGPIAMSPHIAKVGYDVEKELTAVANIASVPNLVAVHPSVKAKNLSELVALSRGSTAQLNYASAGNGTTAHFAGELFKSLAGSEAAHIPYKGTSAAMIDLVSGQVHFAIDNLPAMLPFVQSGQLRPLAVTGTERSSAAPDVPTSAEAGMPNLIVKGWFGIFAPKSTPPEIVNYLAREITHIVNTPETQAALRRNGAEPEVRGPKEFAAFVREDNARWAEVARKAKLRVE
jgi:tripartite-type tricarboxylate transporter receptor subunit TctC